MSVTIDSLDIQIKTSAGQAETNIDALAKALGRLKENSNLTKVTNNLSKLATSLEALNKATSGLNNLDKIGTALNGLTGVQKLSGLNSALNTLKKLPDIMVGLDESKLAKFATQMQKLATAMEPLATRITQVAKGFSNLPSKLTSAVSATNRLTSSQKSLGEQLDVTSANLFTNMSNLEMLIGVARQFITAMAGVIDQAIGWDGIQFRFGRAFGDDAEEMYQYILKINEALGINIQEFMQYSSMYGSLLSGFGLTQDKVSTISIGLSELTYDLWAANNDVVKRYEDVAVAVKSAITGEIEPIRNLGIAMTEASLQEFINTTHLAGISIENMTEAQKAEVRYAAMVNAAMNQGIVGTYAKEMYTAEGAVRDFSQTLKTLYQAFGSLFIPILQKVVPYVTAFVEILTDAVHAVADFFGIELFKIDWSNQSNGIGGLADGATDAATGLGSAAKAAKKLKDYTMGFDELNVISPDSGSGGSGGSGVGGAADWGSGLDLDTLWDDAVLEQARRKVDELKQSILDFADRWSWAFGLAGLAVGKLAFNKAWPLLTSMGANLVTRYNKVADVFKALGKVAKGPQTLFDSLKGGTAASSALTFMFPTLTKIATVIGTITKVLSTMWLPISAIIVAVGSAIYFVYENWDRVTKAVKDFFAENIAPKLEEIGKHFDKVFEAMGPVGDWLKKIGKGIADFFANIDMGAILKGIGKVFEWLGGIVFSVVGGVIAGAFNTLVGFIENAIQVFSGAVQIIRGVVDLVVAIFSGGDIGKAWSKIWDGVVDVAKGLWGILYHPFKNFTEGIMGFLDDLWGDVTEIFSIKKWKKLITDAVGTIKDNLKLPSFPSISLSVTWDKNVGAVKKAVYEALGLEGWPKLKWSKYAMGGMPSMGEMFIAREAGPELVGRIGNRSAVVNNDQIVEAVSRGVYDAVRAASGGDNGGQNINVYLDGKQLYASVKRTEGQRGRTLMGNQLGYLY